MSTALLIDTETTGIDEPDVIELAWMGPLHAFSPPTQPVQCQRFKPRKPITLGALATHHILDEELAQEPEWSGTWSPPADYMIGHKVDFDWEAIGKPDNVKRICTLALARRLWPDLDSHSLAALTYHFTDRHEARELLKSAHGAATDVELCCRVLGQILRAMPKIASWDRLWDASERARVPTHMTFGKFGPDEAWAKANGGPMPCADVRRLDPSYYSWLMNKCDQVRDDPYYQKALRGEPA